MILDFQGEEKLARAFRVESERDLVERAWQGGAFDALADEWRGLSWNAGDLYPSTTREIARVAEEIVREGVSIVESLLGREVFPDNRVLESIRDLIWSAAYNRDHEEWS